MIAAAVALGLLAAVARAQDWVWEREGRLVLEEVVTLEDDRSLRARSTGSDDVAALRLDAAGSLASYSAEDGSQSVSVEPAPGGVRLLRAVGSARREIVAPAEPPFVVFDPESALTALQLGRLARSTEGSIAFRAILPAEQRVIAGELRRIGTTELLGADGPFEAAALEARVGVHLLRVFLDVGSEAVLVEVPHLSLVARARGVERPVADVDAAPREIAIEVPSPAGLLPGLLTLPADGAGPFPAVVLIAGAGAHDRDESLGTFKPFRDIAQGLATRGIASLRHDKRTRVLSDPPPGAPPAERRLAQLALLTLREEAIDDARTALGLLAARPEIDPGALFVLGHDLGSLAALELARERGLPIAGLALVAPVGRPFDEVLRDSLLADARAAGLSPELALRAVEQQLRPLAGARDGSLPDGQLVSGVTGRYWKDLLARDPAASLAQLTLPVLLVRGSLDQGCTPDDVARLLAARPDGATELLELPDIDHFLRHADDDARADPAAVAALAQWIAARP